MVEIGFVKICIIAVGAVFLLLASMIVLKAFMNFIGMGEDAQFVVLILASLGITFTVVGSIIDEDD